MNSLIFNPHTSFIHEWGHIHLSDPEIEFFESTIDRTCNYLSAIDKKTSRKLSSRSDSGPLR